MNSEESETPTGDMLAKPGQIPQTEVDALREAWKIDPADLGIGLYNPQTGELHVKSMDSLQGAGHHGLANELEILNRNDWRGFVIVSTGAAENISHFNQGDKDFSGNSMRMRPEYFEQVLAALRTAGLPLILD